MISDAHDCLPACFELARDAEIVSPFWSFSLTSAC